MRQLVGGTAALANARFCVLAVFLVASSAFGQATARAQTPPILTPTGARDTAIWIHPTDRKLSLVFGTDQFGGSGLFAYGLDGALRQRLDIGNVVGVDVRYGFRTATGTIDVVLAVNTDGSFRIFSPNASSGSLTLVGQGSSNGGTNAGAFYFSGGTLQVYIAASGGELRHYRIGTSAAGLTVALVRTLQVTPAPRAIAVDDRGQRAFLSIPNDGVYTVQAEPDAIVALTLVDNVAGGRLAGAAGLALYFTPTGGYIIVSASQANAFRVYSLGAGFPFVTSFTIAAGAVIGGVTNSKGLDVVAYPVGTFDKGLLVAHDEGSTNYKLVSWDAIATSTSPLLTVDTRVDPRVPATGGTGGSGGSGGPGGGTSSPGGNANAPPFGGGGGVQQPNGCHCSHGNFLMPLVGLGLLLLLRRARNHR